MPSLAEESGGEPLAVCFDATGTLITTAEPVGETYRRVALAHGVDLPAWRLEDAFRRILRHAPSRGLDGETPAARRRAEVDWWFERIRQTFQATDSSARFEDFEAFASALFDAYRAPDAWRAEAGVVATLARLRQRGARMAVASNFDHRLLEILEHVELEAFFEFISIPSSHGLAKPDPRLFRLLAEQLEVPIGRLHYVGDDAKQTLRAIADQGVRVIDRNELGDFEALIERVEHA